MSKFEQVWASLSKFEQVWTSLNKFELVWASLSKFEQVWASLIQKNSEIIMQINRISPKCLQLSLIVCNSTCVTTLNCLCTARPCAVAKRYKWVWLIAALFLVLQQFYDDKNDFFYGWQSRFWPKKAQYRHKRDCRNRERKKEEKKIEISSCYPISPLLELN